MNTTLGIIALAGLTFLFLSIQLVPEFHDALDRLARVIAYVLLVPFVILKAFFVDYDPTDYNNNAY